MRPHDPRDRSPASIEGPELNPRARLRFAGFGEGFAADRSRGARGRSGRLPQPRASTRPGRRAGGQTQAAIVLRKTQAAIVLRKTQTAVALGKNQTAIPFGKNQTAVLRRKIRRSPSCRAGRSPASVPKESRSL
jgi:hypothetical protein